MTQQIIEGFEVGCVVKCKQGRNKGRVGRIIEINHDRFDKGNDFNMKTTIEPSDYVSPLCYDRANETDLIGEDYRQQFDFMLSFVK